MNLSLKQQQSIRNSSLCLCFLCFFGTANTSAQIRVSELIQESAITTHDDYALYFVDFWATWCRPCIYVSKYLETLQEQYPESLYVLSLSKETPSVVKDFMNNHDFRLAVAIDYESETFEANSVSGLPRGALYNAQGKQLWTGHPADLKASDIAYFLSKNSTQISKKTWIHVEPYRRIIEPVMADDPIEDFSITLLNTSTSEALTEQKHENYVEFTGNLRAILAYALNVFEAQVELPKDLNKLYQMRFKYDGAAHNQMLPTIMEALGVTVSEGELTGDALVLDLKSPHLWDTKQIDWGARAPSFLVGDTEIQADNVSIEKLAYKLANVLETPVVFSSSNIPTDLHDWVLHYRYFDLMKTAISDSFGIELTKKEAVYPVYTFEKKGAVNTSD